MTPAQRHGGVDTAPLEDRVKVYEAACPRNPEQWIVGQRATGSASCNCISILTSRCTPQRNHRKFNTASKMSFNQNLGATSLKKFRLTGRVWLTYSATTMNCAWHKAGGSASTRRCQSCQCACTPNLDRRGCPSWVHAAISLGLVPIGVLADG